MDVERVGKSRRKLDYTEYLVPGEFVDVNDYVSKIWRLAYVVEIVDGEVEVIYEGMLKCVTDVKFGIDYLENEGNIKSFSSTKTPYLRYTHITT